MIYEQLYPWQKSLVDSICKKQAYGLFLDMGLGKTPISLALAEKHQSERILIITLNNKACENEKIKGSWFDWITKMDKQYKLSNKKESSFLEPNIAYMVNYEFLEDRKSSNVKGISIRKNILDFIESCKGKNVTVILDESHKMKSQKSNQTKCVQKIYTKLSLISNVKLYLLTGTPFTNGYIDLYTQLKILGNPMTKEEFRDLFCVMGNIRGLYNWQQPIVSYKNIDRLFDLIHRYAITIDSKEVIDLPEQIFVYHDYTMTNEMKLFISEKSDTKSINKELSNRNLDKIENNKTRILNPFFRNFAYPEFKWIAETSSEFWLRSRELSIGFQGNADQYTWYDMTRINMLRKFLEENPGNYILFYSFTPELIQLFTLCEELEYSIDVYCGEIKSLKNYNEYSNMDKGLRMVDNKKRILICNWQSGSTGMNFQAYNKCIIFDLPIFRDWQQGIKRIHRIGQDRNCIYHVFMQNNFLDQGMLKAINTQQDYTKDTFESDLKRIKEILK